MSGAVQRKPPKGRPFQKGVSGNPGGKPKGEHVSVIARAHTADAVKALVLALRSPRERVPAAIALLDRGWGKPVQMIAADPDRPIAIEFAWSDATQDSGVSTPNTHTDARAVATQIEGAIIEAAIEGDQDDKQS
jgi:hypothetical protein